MTRSETREEIVRALLELIERTAEGDRGRVTATARDVASYAAERAAHLALLVGKPGFQEAVVAERDNVRLRAAKAMVEAGDLADARLREGVEVALTLGARLLALAA